MSFVWVQDALTRRRSRGRKLSQPLLIVSGCVVTLSVLLAILGPLISPYSPTEVDILAPSLPPSAQHWFGTDSLGRDIFSRVLHGAGLSYLAAASIVLIATVLGTAIALLAAWRGGWIDGLVTRGLNVLFAVPSILIAILATAVFGVGMWAPVLALSVVYIPYIARVVRSVAVKERKRPYVESLQLSGLSSLRIVIFHILPNVFPTVLAQATFGFGSAILDFASVSFLGLGVQPPAAELGIMVFQGRDEILNGAFQQTFAASAVIIITVVALNVFGDQLTTWLGRR